METLGERIQYALDTKRITRKELATSLGVSTMAIGNLIRNEVQKPRILDIAVALGVRTEWLQSGQGEMENGLQIVPYQGTTEDSDDVVIDVLNVEASAGYGSHGDFLEVVTSLHFMPEQFSEIYRGINPKNVQLINVRGDSMYPTFSHGDLVFVDTTIQHFDGDGVYIFTYDDYTYIKRLQKAGRELRVLSDNKEIYPEPWSIIGEEIHQVHIHGKVKIHQSQQLNFIG